MAYAALAGLPPIYGLYAATLPLVAYGLLGTARQLAVGPAAMVSLLVATSVAEVADPASYLPVAILLAALVGLMQLALGFLRLGFLVNFLSQPVIAGFTSAAAIIIGLSQLKHILGIAVPRVGSIWHQTQVLTQQLGSTHNLTLCLGMTAIVGLVLLKRFVPKIPAALVAVVFGIVVVYALDAATQGVAIVGVVPKGLPSLQIPAWDITTVKELWPMALTIALVSFMESSAIAKSLQARHPENALDSNQELRALGVSNVLGSLVGAFPTTGGLSRSAVNDQAGAKTGIASLVSAATITLVLLFFTQWFYHLPMAVLAAIIMVAVLGLVDVSRARKLWETDRRDFLMMMITFVVTLALGIREGILTGVFLSLGMVLYRSTYPHIAVLGKLPGTRQYRNVSRFPEVVQHPGVLILRFDAQLFFANVPAFQERLAVERKRVVGTLALVVLDFAAVNGLDSTAAEALARQHDEYQAQGVALYFTAVKGPVRDIMHRSGLMDKVGRAHFFMDNEQAMQVWLGEKKSAHEMVAAAAQTNLTSKT